MKRPLVKAAGWALAAAVLGSVFAAYLSPHFSVDLATRFWACF